MNSCQKMNSERDRFDFTLPDKMFNFCIGRYDGQCTTVNGLIVVIPG